MDINPANPTAAQTHEPDTETRTTPFTNGVLKRRHAAPLHLHHHHPVVVTYKECLKNHAAATGGHSVDGCGEFMPSPASNPSDPTSFRCAVCGCHRNFHRRDHDASAAHTPLALEYHPYHRHLPPPPRVSPDNSPSLSPPPISSAYPHGLSSSLSKHGHHHEQQRRFSASGSGHVAGIGFNGTRKRCRTKFTQHQKVKMLELAERIGWTMQKRDEDLIINFCNEIGVERWVFKVWMHNNKNTTNSSKKDHPCSSNNADNNGNNRNDGVNGNDQEMKDIHIHPQQLQQEVDDDSNGSEHGVGLN